MPRRSSRDRRDNRGPPAATDKARQQQSGADQQHDRNGDLGDDQRASAGGLRPGSSPRLLASLLHRADRSTRELQRRQRAEQHTRDDRNDQREQQHRGSMLDLPGARGEAADERRSASTRSTPANNRPTAAAGHREQRALGEQLARPAGRARRRARRARRARDRGAAGAPASDSRRSRRRSAARGRWSRAGSAASASRCASARSRTAERRGREARCRGDRRPGCRAREAAGRSRRRRRRALAGDARLQPAEHGQRRERAAVLRDAPLRRGAERARRHRHVDVVLLRIVRHVGGSTPTTVCGRSFISKTWPTMSGRRRTSSASTCS